MEEKNQLAPFIGLKEGVIFPETEAVLTFGRPASITSVQDAFAQNAEVCFVSQIDSKKTALNASDYYTIGTVCRIVKVLPVNEELHAIVRGLFRVKINEVLQRDGDLWAVVEPILDEFVPTANTMALSNRAIALVRRVSELGKTNLDPSLLGRILNGSDPQLVSFQISAVINAKNVDKQKLLEENSLEKRLGLAGDLLTEEIKILELERKIENKTQKKFDENMKENILRERMRSIQKELGGWRRRRNKRAKSKTQKSQASRRCRSKSQKELDRLPNFPFITRKLLIYAPGSKQF